MRFLTAFIITILLALVASGCEREDLTYEKEDSKKTEEKTDGKQDPKTGKDDSDDPNHPGDPNNPDTPPAPDPASQALAAQVNGEWQGKLSTSYYDDYGVKQTGEYTTQMQPKMPSAARAVRPTMMRPAGRCGAWHSPGR